MLQNILNPSLKAFSQISLPVDTFILRGSLDDWLNELCPVLASSRMIPTRLILVTLTLVFLAANYSSGKSKWSLVEVEDKEEHEAPEDAKDEVDGQEVDAEDGNDYRKVIEQNSVGSNNFHFPFRLFFEFQADPPPRHTFPSVISSLLTGAGAW